MTAYCPLCKIPIETFKFYDDPGDRFIGHTRTTGYRAGRECENSGHVVIDCEDPLVEQVTETVRRWRSEGRTKQELLVELGKILGIGGEK